MKWFSFGISGDKHICVSPLKESGSFPKGSNPAIQI